jgi:hypothetical protein
MVGVPLHHYHDERIMLICIERQSTNLLLTKEVCDPVSLRPRHMLLLVEFETVTLHLLQVSGVYVILSFHEKNCSQPSSD